MSAADIPIRETVRRLQKRFETALITLSDLRSTILNQRTANFETKALFLASAGDFQMAWLNNAASGDGIVSVWVRADSGVSIANTTDVVTVGGNKFFQIYVRENL